MCRGKRIEDSRLVPVILDLVTHEEIEDASTGASVSASRPGCVLRLFRQAHEQGGVLSGADIGLLLHMSNVAANRIARSHERANREMPIAA